MWCNTSVVSNRAYIKNPNTQAQDQAVAPGIGTSTDGETMQTRPLFTSLVVLLFITICISLSHFNMRTNNLYGGVRLTFSVLFVTLDLVYILGLLCVILYFIFLFVDVLACGFFYFNCKYFYLSNYFFFQSLLVCTLIWLFLGNIESRFNQYQ